jgi:hypothetical protein
MYCKTHKVESVQCLQCEIDKRDERIKELEADQLNLLDSIQTLAKNLSEFVSAGERKKSRDRNLRPHRFKLTEAEGRPVPKFTEEGCTCGTEYGIHGKNCRVFYQSKDEVLKDENGDPLCSHVYCTLELRGEKPTWCCSRCGTPYEEFKTPEKEK